MVLQCDKPSYKKKRCTPASSIAKTWRRRAKNGKGRSRRLYRGPLAFIDETGHKHADDVNAPALPKGQAPGRLRAAWPFGAQRRSSPDCARTRSSRPWSSIGRLTVRSSRRGWSSTSRNQPCSKATSSSWRISADRSPACQRSSKKLAHYCCICRPIRPISIPSR